MTAQEAFQNVDQALDALLGRIKPVGLERVPLSQAAGRILGESIRSDRPSPACDVSAMDGYAVRLADLARDGATELAVTGDVLIGREPPAMPTGSALRIVTGAPVPTGVEAIIIREDVTEHEGRITITPAAVDRVKPGQHIRRKGENLSADQLAIEPGTRITPPVLGALSSFGVTEPTVHRVVCVGVVVTGDEVLPADAQPNPWQLRDSNGPALMGMLAGKPWIEPTVRTHAGDDREALLDTVGPLLADCDAVMLTGGVSMGNRDYVPEILQRLGAEIVFHRLPQKPGKPVLGAIGPDATPILGLPGNPVSVMVTARRMGSAVLCTLGGRGSPRPPAMVRLDEPNDRRLKLWWFRPVRLTGPGSARLVSNKGSGDIVAAGKSDGFVEIPPNTGGPGPWPFYPWEF